MTDIIVLDDLAKKLFKIMKTENKFYSPDTYGFIYNIVGGYSYAKYCQNSEFNIIPTDDIDFKILYNRNLFFERLQTFVMNILLSLWNDPEYYIMYNGNILETVDEIESINLINRSFVLITIFTVRDDRNVMDLCIVPEDTSSYLYDMFLENSKIINGLVHISINVLIYDTIRMMYIAIKYTSNDNHNWSRVVKFLNYYTKLIHIYSIYSADDKHRKDRIINEMDALLVKAKEKTSAINKTQDQQTTKYHLLSLYYSRIFNDTIQDILSNNEMVQDCFRLVIEYKNNCINKSKYNVKPNARFFGSKKCSVNNTMSEDDARTLDKEPVIRSVKKYLVLV